MNTVMVAGQMAKWRGGEAHGSAADTSYLGIHLFSLNEKATNGQMTLCSAFNLIHVFTRNLSLKHGF
jgi:hypothetical protein